MRKLILSMMVSVNGFIEDPKKDISWHVWDKEMDKYMNSFLSKIDTILLGRIAYQLMADYWPSASTEDSFITGQMNALPKIVFSKTLKKAEWNNSRIINENIPEEILKLKQQPGKNLVLFGGAEISWAFMKLGLIDEFHLIINPVVLGGGKLLFKRTENKSNLKLINVHQFKCGNVIHFYEPIR